MPKAIESPIMQIGASSPIPTTIVNTVNIETPGPQFALSSGAILSIPGVVSQSIISQSPAPGTSWRIRRIDVSSRSYGIFYLMVGTREVARAYTNPGNPTVSLSIEPWEIVSSDELVELFYEQQNGAVVPISAKINYTM